MIKYFVLILFILNTTGLKSQKPAIDLNALGKWPAIEKVDINSNGLYYYYLTEDRNLSDRTLTVLSDKTNWKATISHVSPDKIFFSADGKKLLFLKSEDSLGILTLGSSSVQYFKNVLDFKLSGNSSQEWMGYIEKTSDKRLVLCNLLSKKIISFSGVADFTFGIHGDNVVLQSECSEDIRMRQVILINLIDLKETCLWKGLSASQFVFDKDGRQLAFMANDTSAEYSTIYYLKYGMIKAKLLVDGRMLKISQQDRVPGSIIGFSNDGTKLHFYAINKNGDNSNDVISTRAPNVWNYKDRYLQSVQLSAPFIEQVNQNEVTEVIDLRNFKISALTKAGEYVNSDIRADSKVLVYKEEFGFESTTDGFNCLYLVDREKENHRELLSKNENIALQSLSPNGKFVAWFDMDSLTYWAYDVAKQIKINISKSVPTALVDEYAVARGFGHAAFGIAGWGAKTDELFIYDKYDIWKIDLNEPQKAINITHGIGRKERITFGIVDLSHSINTPSIESNQTLLLSGYSSISKVNSFWKIDLLRGGIPVCESAGPFCSYISRIGTVGNDEYPANVPPPIKAKLAGKYLVSRMSAESFPNWYVTDDFKSFKQISSLVPEQSVNWLTAELIDWPMMDGSHSQGILYKPENFDSTKKYPVIFMYYEKLSNEFHNYWVPGYSDARLNIPFFVSNGYLIFLTDNYYKRGHNGESVVNSVVSAANYLSKFPWVDSTRLGLQGHSFGGWETNYLITHSHLFAAACEASGVCDQVSSYGQLNFFTGGDRQKFYEQYSQGSAYGLGVTPWTKPDLYMENSPIFYLKDVNTPLLMMHGDQDKAVPVQQAIEMFLGLRRAGKKVWLLHYDKAGHTLWNDIDARDFTIRVKQFFDFYLKDGYPPVWMTKGVPASLKGRSLGLDLDTSGEKP